MAVSLYFIKKGSKLYQNQWSVNYLSFESCEIVFSMGSKCFTLFVIYRPPPSRTNELTKKLFFEEFRELTLHKI